MDEATRAYWMSLRFSEGKIIKFEDEMQHVLRTLSFGSPDHQFDDMISTIHTRARMKYLLVGMESGYVFVFWVPGNRAKGIIRADKWINNLFLTHNEIFVSGRHRRIEAYSIHGLKPVFRLQANQNQEAYSSKGLMFSDLGWANRLIMNTGGVTFTILNAKTRKVLQIFSIPEHALKYPGEPNSSSPRVILNYAVQPKRGLLMFMVREDPNLYFWDLRSSKIVKHFELYKVQHTRQNNIIVINVLMGCTKDSVITIIQFAKNTVPRRIKSICYVQSTIDISPKATENRELELLVEKPDLSPEPERMPEPKLEFLPPKLEEEPDYQVNGHPNLQIEHMFHSELGRILTDLAKANEYFLSMSVNPIMPSYPVGKSTQGMLLLLGDNQGGSYCMVVDTKTKVAYTYITRKTESKHEEISTIMFTFAGSVKATLSGEIHMVSLLDSEHIRDRSLNKDLQDS